MKPKILVILGSTRQGRFVDQPGHFIMSELQKNPEVEAELADLRDYPMPFFDSPTSPSMNGGVYDNEVVKLWSAKVKSADGYIIVTPEYNHGYPAVLKNALDELYPEWQDKPVGFVGYGSVGAARAIEQLRQVAIELHLVPVRTSVNINAYWSMLDDKGQLITTSFEKNAAEMIGQVVWYANKLK